jgi:hypothetical protein
VYYPQTRPDTAGKVKLMKWMSSLGTLRVLLMLAAIACIAAAPFATGATHVHDWRLLPTVIAPTIMVMLLFAIPLDICMARVFMSDSNDSEKARLNRAITIELTVLGALALAWSPFMLKLMDIWPFA